MMGAAFGYAGVEFSPFEQGVNEGDLLRSVRISRSSLAPLVSNDSFASDQYEWISSPFTKRGNEGDFVRERFEKSPLAPLFQRGE